MAEELVIHTDGSTERLGNNIAVNDLPAEMTRRQVQKVLGLNGFGKATTIGILLGVLTLMAGDFSLHGSTARHEEPRRRGNREPGLLSIHLGPTEPRVRPVHFWMRLDLP